ncbi:mannitol dehydrogenase family protein [Thalassotalea fonticola]|uniref:Mannitol dehydrogenase family protein n=1 Tax=Thalassotalea fonticola TaxID=3065649 RepID=A0ABZ0GJJ6_9GAMM|nr:mannitol dehydrogenase family protein [Colwelliaceae bacterium S1-1]
MQNILSEQNIALTADDVYHCGYDREPVNIGIVHFGPGAFHRAHQAVYTNELLLNGETDWGICEVSINSPSVRDALLPQDNLYTLAILDHSKSYQIIGAIKEILVAPEDPALVIERLCQPQIKVVTLTITEKGYCLTAQGGLDFANAGIVHDLENPTQPQTAIGFLVAGLLARYNKGMAPFVAISCDNVSDNGTRLKTAVIEFARTLDGNFAQWLTNEVKFPCTMVDSITPATNEMICASVAQQTGFKDNWPIQREQFSQWVIEDIPGVELPPWSTVGAILTTNVSGYELTKLRVLNCLHSTLAFIGSFTGLETVEQAIANPILKTFVESLLSEEIFPTLPTVDGLDKVSYGNSIIKRFQNPAICHLLAQIACDSSQKIPYRIIAIIEDNLAMGKNSTKLCLSLAAWMRFVTDKVSTKQLIIDPLAEQLTTIAKLCNGSDADVERFLALEHVFPQHLRENNNFVDTLTQAYSLFNQYGAADISLILTTMKED